MFYYCCMLDDMVLNGKDVDIDELMLQLVVENVLKEYRYGEMRRDDEQKTPRDQVNDHAPTLQGEKISKFN